MVIFTSRKKKPNNKKQLSSVYTYELDLGLDQISEGVMLSLELDLEVDLEGLIHSSLLRSRSNSVKGLGLDLDLIIAFTTEIIVFIVIRQFKSVTRIICSKTT